MMSSKCTSVYLTLLIWAIVNTAQFKTEVVSGGENDEYGNKCLIVPFGGDVKGLFNDELQGLLDPDVSSQVYAKASVECHIGRSLIGVNTESVQHVALYDIPEFHVLLNGTLSCAGDAQCIHKWQTEHSLRNMGRLYYDEQYGISVENVDIDFISKLYMNIKEKQVSKYFLDYVINVKHISSFISDVADKEIITLLAQFVGHGNFLILQDCNQYNNYLLIMDSSVTKSQFIEMATLILSHKKDILDVLGTVRNINSVYGKEKIIRMIESSADIINTLYEYSANGMVQLKSSEQIQQYFELIANTTRSIYTNPNISSAFNKIDEIIYEPIKGVFRRIDSLSGISKLVNLIGDIQIPKIRLEWGSKVDAIDETPTNDEQLKNDTSRLRRLLEISSDHDDIKYNSKNSIKPSEFRKLHNSTGRVRYKRMQDMIDREGISEFLDKYVDFLKSEFDEDVKSLNKRVSNALNKRSAQLAERISNINEIVDSHLGVNLGNISSPLLSKITDVYSRTSQYLNGYNRETKYRPSYKRFIKNVDQENHFDVYVDNVKRANDDNGTNKNTLRGRGNKIGNEQSPLTKAINKFLNLGIMPVGASDEIHRYNKPEPSSAKLGYPFGDTAYDKTDRRTNHIDGRRDNADEYDKVNSMKRYVEENCEHLVYSSELTRQELSDIFFECLHSIEVTSRQKGGKTQRGFLGPSDFYYRDEILIGNKLPKWLIDSYKALEIFSVASLMLALITVWKFIQYVIFSVVFWLSSPYFYGIIMIISFILILLGLVYSTIKHLYVYFTADTTPLDSPVTGAFEYADHKTKFPDDSFGVSINANHTDMYNDHLIAGEKSLLNSLVKIKGNPNEVLREEVVRLTPRMNIYFDNHARDTTHLAGDISRQIASCDAKSKAMVNTVLVGPNPFFFIKNYVYTLHACFGHSEARDCRRFQDFIDECDRIIALYNKDATECFNTYHFLEHSEDRYSLLLAIRKAYDNGTHQSETRFCFQDSRKCNHAAGRIMCIDSTYNMDIHDYMKLLCAHKSSTLVAYTITLSESLLLKKFSSYEHNISYEVKGADAYFDALGFNKILSSHDQNAPTFSIPLETLKLIPSDAVIEIKYHGQEFEANSTSTYIHNFRKYLTPLLTGGVIMKSYPPAAAFEPVSENSTPIHSPTITEFNRNGRHVSYLVTYRDTHGNICFTPHTMYSDDARLKASRLVDVAYSEFNKKNDGSLHYFACALEDGYFLHKKFVMSKNNFENDNVKEMATERRSDTISIPLLMHKTLVLVLGLTSGHYNSKLRKGSEIKGYLLVPSAYIKKSREYLARNITGDLDRLRSAMSQFSSRFVLGFFGNSHAVEIHTSTMNEIIVAHMFDNTHRKTLMQRNAKNAVDAYLISNEASLNNSIARFIQFIWDNTFKLCERKLFTLRNEVPVSAFRQPPQEVNIHTFTHAYTAVYSRHKFEEDVEREKVLSIFAEALSQRADLQRPTSFNLDDEIHENVLVPDEHDITRQHEDASALDDLLRMQSSVAGGFEITNKMKHDGFTLQVFQILNSNSDEIYYTNDYLTYHTTSTELVRQVTGGQRRSNANMISGKYVMCYDMRERKYVYYNFSYVMTDKPTECEIADNIMIELRDVIYNNKTYRCTNFKSTSNYACGWMLLLEYLLLNRVYVRPIIFFKHTKYANRSLLNSYDLAGFLASVNLWAQCDVSHREYNSENEFMNSISNLNKKYYFCVIKGHWYMYCSIGVDGGDTNASNVKPVEPVSHVRRSESPYDVSAEKINNDSELIKALVVNGNNVNMLKMHSNDYIKELKQQNSKFHKDIADNINNRIKSEDHVLSVKTSVLHGCPGSGKSSIILNMAEKFQDYHFIINVHSNTLYASFKTKFKNCKNVKLFTYEKFFSRRDKFPENLVLVIDEYMLRDLKYITTACYYCKPKLLILVGDPNQLSNDDIQFDEVDAKYSLKDFIKKNVKKFVDMQHTNRLSSDVCNIISQRGYNFITTNKHEKTITLAEAFTGMTLPDIISQFEPDVIITSTSHERDALSQQLKYYLNKKHIDVVSITQSQGSEWQKVLLCLTVSGTHNIKSRPYLNVGLTRHKDKLVIICPKREITSIKNKFKVNYDVITPYAEVCSITDKQDEIDYINEIREVFRSRINVNHVDNDDKVDYFNKETRAHVEAKKLDGATIVSNVADMMSLNHYLNYDSEPINDSYNIKIVNRTRNDKHGRFDVDVFDTCTATCHLQSGHSFEVIPSEREINSINTDYIIEWNRANGAIYFNKIIDQMTRVKQMACHRLSNISYSRVYRSSDIYSALYTITKRYLVHSHLIGNKHMYVNFLLQSFENFCNKAFRSTEPLTDEETNLAFNNAIMSLEGKLGYKDILDEMLTQNFNKMSYHLKTQHKPFFGKDILLKFKTTPNQGVVATNKGVNVLLIVLMRIIEDRINKWLPSYIKIFNGIPDYYFSDFVIDKLNGSDNTRYFECDFTSFDSSQNEISVMLEVEIFQRMCPELIGTELIEMYQKLRMDWIASNEYVKWHGSGVKCSGEPATLLGNTMVNMLIIISSFIFEGVKFCLFKGDDSLIACESFKPIVILQDDEFFVRFDMRGHLKEVGYFASLIFSKKGMHLNIPRLSSKILSRQFDDKYPHREFKKSITDSIAEYQNGVWALVYPYKVLDEDFKDTIEANAEYYQVDRKVISTLTDQINFFVNEPPKVIADLCMLKERRESIVKNIGVQNIKKNLELKEHVKELKKRPVGLGYGKRSNRYTSNYINFFAYLKQYTLTLMILSLMCLKSTSAFESDGSTTTFIVDGKTITRSKDIIKTDDITATQEYLGGVQLYGLRGGVFVNDLFNLSLYDNTYYYITTVPELVGYEMRDIIHYTQKFKTENEELPQNRGKDNKRSLNLDEQMLQPAVTYNYFDYKLAIDENMIYSLNGTINDFVIQDVRYRAKYKYSSTVEWANTMTYAIGGDTNGFFCMACGSTVGVPECNVINDNEYEIKQEFEVQNTLLGVTESKCSITFTFDDVRVQLAEYYLEEVPMLEIDYVCNGKTETVKFRDSYYIYCNNETIHVHFEDRGIVPDRDLTLYNKYSSNGIEQATRVAVTSREPEYAGMDPSEGLMCPVLLGRNTMSTDNNYECVATVQYNGWSVSHTTTGASGIIGDLSKIENFGRQLHSFDKSVRGGMLNLRLYNSEYPYSGCNNMINTCEVSSVKCTKSSEYNIEFLIMCDHDGTVNFSNLEIIDFKEIGNHTKIYGNKINNGTVTLNYCGLEPEIVTNQNCEPIKGVEGSDKKNGFKEGFTGINVGSSVEHSIGSFFGNIISHIDAIISAIFNLLILKTIILVLCMIFIPRAGFMVGIVIVVSLTIRDYSQSVGW